MNSVSQPFNPEKFNFTKVQSKEVRSQLSLLNQSEQQEFPCGFRAKKDRGTARNGIFWFWPPQKWNEWPFPYETGSAVQRATKSLQNSCTAKLQLFSSVLEAKQQLNLSCSGMQKRCAAFEGSLKLSAAVLQRSCRLSNAAKQLL